MFHSRGKIEKLAICCHILKNREDIYWLSFNTSDISYAMNLLSEHLNVSFVNKCKLLDIIYILFFVKTGKYSDGIIINALNTKNVRYREALLLYYPAIIYATFMYRSPGQVECIIIIKPYCTSFYFPVSFTILLFIMLYIVFSMVVGVIPSLSFAVSGFIVLAINVITYKVAQRLYNKIRRRINVRLRQLCTNKKVCIKESH